MGLGGSEIKLRYDGHSKKKSYCLQVAAHHYKFLGINVKDVAPMASSLNVDVPTYKFCA
jgi:hypothetical protein